MKGEARRREGRLRQYDCDRDSETVIATGRSRRAARPPAAWWRRREMQRSYERRRWLRDGGRGGAGLSRRGACCCGVSVVIFLFSSSWAPAKRAAADRRAPPFFSFAAPRPSRGRKHASSRSHCAASPRRKKNGPEQKQCSAPAARGISNVSMAGDLYFNDYHF